MVTIVEGPVLCPNPNAAHGFTSAISGIYSARILEATLICSQYASVDKTIYTNQSKLFSREIAKMRKKAGLTQRDLAAKLNREHSLVGRIELGERRVDMIEFYWICKACGVVPDRKAADLMRVFAKHDS